MDQRFGENDFRASEVAEFEVAGRVFCDLLPEAGLELEEVVVDPWSDYFESVVHVCEIEEGFAVEVCFGDVERVECGRVVVEDAEEVVVVAEQV